MLVNTLISSFLYVSGVFFFLAGSVGLLRFPDLASRIHALTKADNVGLACIAAAVAISSNDVFVGIKIILIWLIVIVASSLTSFLIAKQLEKPVHLLEQNKQL